MNDIEPSSPVSTGRLTELITAHLALVASLGVVALSVIRVFFVSGYSVPVGLAVLGAADRAAILGSTVLLVGIAFLPSLLTQRPIIRWLLAGNESGAHLGVVFRTGLMLSPLFALLLGSVSVLALVAIIAGLFTGKLVRLLQSRNKTLTPERVAKTVNLAGWIWASLSGFVLTLVLQQSWMPMENLDLKGHPAPLAGYVVGEQLSDVLVLNSRKQPMWVPSADVTSREICQTDTPVAFLTFPEIARLVAGIPLPKCLTDP